MPTIYQQRYREWWARLRLPPYGLQHQALLAEIVSAAHADSSSSDNSNDDHPAHRRGGGGARHHRGGGGPDGLIGGMMGGLFGRR